ncbi:MAG: translation initiation factor IF-2 [Opitutae bacterium]|nr:translation initiation factor IF-2 [Opitutae bacterium]
MSVRIHAIAKQTGMESKEILNILAERGYEVKSASSTIDNISAESFIEEFSKPEVEESNEEPEATEQPVVEEESTQEVSDPEPTSSAPPLGAIVKSAQQVEEERRQKELEAGGVTETSDPSATQDEEASSAEEPEVPPASGKAPPPPPPSSAPPAPPTESGPEVADDKGDDVAASADSEAVPQAGKILVKPPIVVRDFAGIIGLKPFKLISELMERGIFASMNQSIDEEVAHTLAEAHGFELEIRHRGETATEEPVAKEKVKELEEDDESLLVPRPPVVCILGHVDHGKTTLLDTIRKANVVSGEAGGITQHVAAYQVDRDGHKITFIDTPGHAAFSKMRERGADVTDIAVLVVAADDGFMPQTEEALRFAQKAQNSIVVAINKIDVKGANVDEVKKQMQDRGIASEDWGGETLAVEISALNGDKIEDLLDSILLQAEVMELKANPDAVCEGVVVEGQIEQGRGPTATVIVQKGTLKTGDGLVCGDMYCKVRAMMDERGEAIKTAPPSTPVKVMGWNDVPEAGAHFQYAKNEKAAKVAAELNARDSSISEAGLGQKVAESSVEALFSAIAQTERKVFRAVVRADVQGSLEALLASLQDVGGEKVDFEAVQVDVGPIAKNDVVMANTSDAAIIGFGVKMDNGVMGLAKHHGTKIYQNNIIYELIDAVKEAMSELLDPELVEKIIGRAEVRQLFPLGRGRNVAGSMVVEGSIIRDSQARLLRGDEVIYEGKVSTLRRFKDDAREVKAGFECGIRLDGFDGYEENDVLECYGIEKIFPTL